MKEPQAVSESQNRQTHILTDIFALYSIDYMPDRVLLSTTRQNLFVMYTISYLL